LHVAQVAVVKLGIDTVHGKYELHITCLNSMTPHSGTPRNWDHVFRIVIFANAELNK